MTKTEAIDEMILADNSVPDICRACRTTPQVVYNRRHEIKEKFSISPKPSANKRLEQIAANTVVIEDEEKRDPDYEHAVKPIKNRIERQKVSEGYRMMSENKSDLQVAMALGLTYDEVSQIRVDYLRMTGNAKLALVYPRLDEACADLQTRRDNLEEELSNRTLLLTGYDKMIEIRRKTWDSMNKQIKTGNENLELINKNTNIAKSKHDQLISNTEYYLKYENFGELESRVTSAASKILHPDLSFWLLPFYSMLWELHADPESTRILLSDTRHFEQLMKNERNNPIFSQVFDNVMKRITTAVGDIALKEILKLPEFVSGKHPELCEIVGLILTKQGYSIRDLVRMEKEASNSQQDIDLLPSQTPTVVIPGIRETDTSPFHSDNKEDNFESLPPFLIPSEESSLQKE